MSATAHSRHDAYPNVQMRRLPVQSRSTQTIECILEAASRLIGMAGRAHYTTNAVAARAGVSIGTLYQYFPNKDALTAALILRVHERIADNLRVVVETTEDLDLSTALARAIEVAIASVGEDGALHRALEQEEDRLPRSDALAAVEAKIEALNAALLERYLDPDRVQGAARHTVAMDAFKMVRAMTQSDAVQVAGPLDLKERMHRAVLGYVAPLCRPDLVGPTYFST